MPTIKSKYDKKKWYRPVDENTDTACTMYAALPEKKILHADSRSV
jgi:hypothetical protein